MSRDESGPQPARAKPALAPDWRIAVAIAAAVLLLGPVLLLAALQAGVFNQAIQGEISAGTGRRVTFGHLSSSVFSLTPTFVIDDLSVGSPPAISTAPLLLAPRAVLRVRLLAALTGQPKAFDVTLTRPAAHLVRLGHGRNNYRLGPGGAATGWRRLGRLEVSDGTLVFEDPERRATLQGRFTHRADAADPWPFHAVGGGVINGEPFTVDARGASLAGRDPALPYPFEAAIQDGRMHVAVAGTSGKPFDVRQLDVRLDAAGPNLADFTYLFQLPAPNTRAFQLSGRLKRAEPALSMTGIVGRLGDTDLRGTLSSDHPAGGRRIIKASLRSDALYLRDLRVVLSPRMSHAQTRAKPGEAPVKPAGGGLLSKAPFKIDSLRRTDLNLQIQAARMPDAPFTVQKLDALLVLTSGRLTLSPATFSTGPGAVSASFGLDASRATPRVTLTGHIRGARLSVLKPGLARTADADLDLDVDLGGDGDSLQAAASRLQGRVAARLTDGRLQRAKAAALGGDLIKAVGLSLGDNGGGQARLECAVADFAAASGRLQAQDLQIVTDVGWAKGQGAIDLGAGTVALTLQGSPAHPRPFQLNAPVHISGPLAHPTVGVDPVRGLDRLAASLPFGSRRTPAPDCTALLARSAAFAGHDR